VQATFSEACSRHDRVLAQDGANNPVRPLTYYDASTTPATLTPSPPLANSTSYARRRGARDLAGNTQSLR